MKRNENLQKNLITLLKIFKNRPYHLSKYLLENLAFSKSFLNKIQNSEKLSSLSDESDLDFPSYFPNITQMEDFYNSLLEEVREISETKRLGDLTENLNSKLVDLINNEKYEEAAALRDYMTKNGINKNS